jgi:hypothetical protein
MGGAALGLCAVVGAARVFMGERAWSIVARAVGVSGDGPARPEARSALLERIHEGLRMLAHPASAAGAAALRALDIGVQGARFIVVAAIVGAPISTDEAILAASTYFIIGMMTPTGQLGFREAGVSGVVALMRRDSFALVVLTVTAADMVVTLTGAVAAGAWLKMRQPNREAGA